MPARLKLAHHVETLQWVPSSLYAKPARAVFFGFVISVATSNRPASLKANRSLSRHLGIPTSRLVTEDLFRAHGQGNSTRRLTFER
jgi:hypothetical protein